MPSILTEEFKVSVAEDFKDSFGNSDTYYLGVHRALPWSNEAEPPTPNNDVQSSHYELYDSLVFGKQITSSNVALMVRNIPWVSGTVYDEYDDTENLVGQDFYVMSDEGSTISVFKCLGNNGGAASVFQPLSTETSPSDELYVTADGYQWKFMYSIPQADQDLFGTPGFMPIVPHANVQGNAVSGALESIRVINAGESYNSYATCTIKESAVSGNTLLYSLDGDQFTDFFLTFADVSGFVEEKVTGTDTQGNASSGVIVGIFAANNTIRVTNVVRGFAVGTDVTGLSSNTTAEITSKSRLTSALSSNTDFYKNSSVYISSGKGAGQLRTITEYIVTGAERRILINTPFDTVPDQTSTVEILPRVIINGDGRSANAIVTMNPTANSILDIEIIDRGEGYTYADIVIAANTGFLDGEGSPILSTQASARAVISPPGGHGANSASELFANKVGIGMLLANTEAGTVPTANDFRSISVLKNPRFANLELTIAEAATNFTAGEIVTQANTGAFGTISNRDANTVTLTNIHGVFETGNSTFNLITGGTSANDAEVVAIDRGQTTFDARQIFQVEVLDLGPLGGGFEEDELVQQTGVDPIATDLINLTVDGSALLFSDGEIVIQANSGAQGTVSNRVSNSLTLSNITGTFTLDDVTGQSTNTTLGVLNKDTSIAANGLGYVHEITSNGTVMALSGVRGTILPSDDIAGDLQTIRGNKSGAEAKVTGRDFTNYYPLENTGEFLYVENFAAIGRSDSQSERIKLIVEF